MTDPAADKAKTLETQQPARTTRAPGSGSLRLMRRLMRDFAGHHRGKLAISVLCGALAAVATAANAVLVKYVLDDAFKEGAAYQTLCLIAGAAMALAVIKGFSSYFQTVLMTTVGQRVVADIQNRLFGRLVHADLALFQATSSGQLISRFTTDANQLRFATTQICTVLGQQALTLVGLVGNMFYQDWLLALIAFVVFPIAIAPVRRMSRRMRKVSLNFQDEMGQYNALLSQVFQGARHVKAYGMEAHETARAAALTEKIYRLFERASRVRSAASPLMESLGGVGIALVILYGGWQVMHGARTAGDFLSFVTSSQVVIKQLSIGLAASILIDATIVRLLLVPAVMYLFGTGSWWMPHWLDRILPHINVEGAPEPRAPAPVSQPIGGAEGAPEPPAPAPVSQPGGATEAADDTAGAPEELKPDASGR